MNFSGKWVELEKIILIEETQTQKDKCHTYFFPRGSYIQIFSCEFISWSNRGNQENKKGPLFGGQWGA